MTVPPLTRMDLNRTEPGRYFARQVKLPHVHMPGRHHPVTTKDGPSLEPIPNTLCPCFALQGSYSGSFTHSPPKIHSHLVV